MPSPSRFLTTSALALGLALFLPAASHADDHGMTIETSVVEAELAKKKINKVGNYITAEETIALMAERDDVALVDVRSPAETMLVGYPTAADANIPFKMIDPAYPFNAEKGRYKMKSNPNFMSEMKTFISEHDPAAVLIICRSGGRSARAVDALFDAGVDTPAYTVVDGFEGDKNADGKREVNGWKNAGGEWTYKLREGFWPAASR
ncbi:rhodanese-like domain-containing protein [Roseovarius sp. SYSU LYC5161]|uniref:rhodanese-like domain-containing protein n=1 Tax=Roseovarius halophilus (ex Wu et al. 2025) TaxID=3376060 RepID=UPI003999F710